MRVAVKLKSGEEGIVVGYAPGKKGRVLAIVVMNAELREVKLRNLEVIGWAKIREAKAEEKFGLWYDMDPSTKTLFPH